MTRLFKILLALCVFIPMISCGSDSYDANITVASDASEGLDLKALTAMIKKIKNGEELEKELNKKNGVNNLDLDEDGKVDYIKVKEYGGQNDSYGFSLTTEPAKGEVQEIASIEIQKKGDNAEVEVRGNENVYGRGHYYRENHFWRNMFLMSYFTRGFGMWHSPYYHGYYPSYYRGYSPVRRSVYTTRTRTYTSGRNIQRSKTSGFKNSNLKNPNKSKSATKGITSRLKNPTKTQKAFQKRNPSKRARSGGFGRRSGSVRRSSGSRSRGSGFGKWYFPIK